MNVNINIDEESADTFAQAFGIWFFISSIASALFIMLVLRPLLVSK